MVVGVVVAASAAASAAVPSLPAKTAAQLLTEVALASNKPVGPLTATVRQTTNLDLPGLPGLGQSGAASALLSGTQSIDIWYGGPKQVRIAVPVPGGESDLRRDGSIVWLWNSKTQTATQVTLPAPTRQGTGAAPPGGAPQGAQVPGTPQAAVSQLLKAIGPSTLVGVKSPVYIAHRPAYQLSFAPVSGQSLIDRVVVAIDATRGIPLGVEVYSRSPTRLAYSLEFTKLSFRAPVAANFSFRPPAHATVKKETVPTDPGALLQGLGLPAGLPAGSAATAPSVQPRVIGQDWLSVVATPANPAVAAAVQQLLSDHSTPQGGSARSGGLFGSSASAAPAPSGSAGANVPVGPYLVPLRALLLASRPVSWNEGNDTGRLLQTTLFSVLVTSKGQILAGAVTPSVLYADVAQDGG